MRIVIGAVALLAVLPLNASAQPHKAGIVKAPFGETPDGQPVDVFTLTNTTGDKVKITNYGGIITEVWVPDRDGKRADVVLGHDTLKGYLDGHPYFGAITGRVANRVAKGKFTLEGKEYTLATNNGPNALHGGKKGFDKVLWKAEMVDNRNPSLILTYTSRDGEEGYPGNLKTTVTYTWTDQDELQIDYQATTDKATPVNLTNHSYFNLKGHDQGDVLAHKAQIYADKYTPTDDTLIPTGKIEPVKGTLYDFANEMVPIGERIPAMKNDPPGYDLNYVLRDYKGFRTAAKVVEPKSGRTLEVGTTEPGVQFYTGNFLSGKDKGKGGAVYNRHAGFCLETQHFPDSVNQESFPTTILRPGETYKSSTVYKFGVTKN